MDDGHIRAINSLATRLERQNCDELDTVKKRKQQLNERYIYSLSHALSHTHTRTHARTHAPRTHAQTQTQTQTHFLVCIL